jgi:hypothetical protein
LPACETLDRSLESGAVETVRQASRRRRECRFYFESPICGFAYMRRVALALNAAVAVNAGALGMRIIAMLPVVQRSARERAAAPVQNAIATKAKRR